jgi:hypothetical protein
LSQFLKDNNVYVQQSQSSKKSQKSQKSQKRPGIACPREMKKKMVNKLYSL